MSSSWWQQGGRTKSPRHEMVESPRSHTAGSVSRPTPSDVESYGRDLNTASLFFFLSGGYRHLCPAREDPRGDTWRSQMTRESQMNPEYREHVLPTGSPGTLGAQEEDVSDPDNLPRQRLMLLREVHSISHQRGDSGGLGHRE